MHVVPLELPFENKNLRLDRARQTHGEGASATAASASGFHAATVEFDDAPNNEQSDTQAAVFARPGLTKDLENVGQDVGCNAPAPIPDIDQCIPAFEAHRDADGRFFLGKL